MPPQRIDGYGKAQRALLATMRLGAHAHETAIVLAEHDQELARLLRITEVLWSLLKEKHGYSDNDLVKRLAEAERRDGAGGSCGGKHGRSLPVVCPACRSTIARMHKRCPYCGQAILHNPFLR